MFNVGDRVVVQDATGNGAHSWSGTVSWIEGDGYRIEFDNGRDGRYSEHEIKDEIVAAEELTDEEEIEAAIINLPARLI